MSFTDYMRKILDEGVDIESERFAVSNTIKMAVEDYGRDDVRKALKHILPNLIEKSYRNQVEKFKFSGESLSYFYRNVSEAFKENYEMGQEIEIAPFVFVKKDREDIVYPSYFKESLVSADGR
jgi:hypothetical protein